MNYYRIADVLLSIEANGQELQPELEDFRVQLESAEEAAEILNADQPTVTIGFALECYRGTTPEKALLKAPMITIYETAETFLVKYNEPFWVECYVVEKHSMRAMIYIKNPKASVTELTQEGRDEIMYSVRDAFFFQLQKLGYIAVHSASIIYKDRAWLFSAASGTGKSTHVEMWKQAGYDMQMLDGDVAVCYVKEGKAYAAGLPWCGTSGIYCNRTVLLGGILFLERSCHNQAGCLNAFEGILRLNARCLTPNWNQELMSSNLHTAEQLTSHITMGVLHCRPEIQAAETAKEFVDNTITCA